MKLFSIPPGAVLEQGHFQIQNNDKPKKLSNGSPLVYFSMYFMQRKLEDS